MKLWKRPLISLPEVPKVKVLHLHLRCPQKDNPQIQRIKIQNTVGGSGGEGRHDYGETLSTICTQVSPDPSARSESTTEGRSLPAEALPIEASTKGASR